MTTSLETSTCYRHPDRETGVSCSACGRPICPDCMTPTQVGMRCPECAGRRTAVRTIRTMAQYPRATYALIAINLIAFLAEQGQFTLSSSAIHGTVIDEGILAREPVALGHQYWRLVTSAFLHENLMHIGFNMLILYWVGRMIEPAIGSARLLAIYLTALLAGSFGALLATPDPSLGASGAIFGLLGAAAVELHARRIPIMQSGIGWMIVINLGYSFLLPHISYGAHIGGLIGGALAAYALRAAGARRMVALGYVGCLAIALASVIGAIIVARSSAPGIV
ncbi:MAG TPA: rhomboid family intramembrane serine protease [Solirubrobacteraceae bacterium]|nr:rhomboid family intramembrane serine protease [Solirubrobacteraceae bacterium]